jgi:predicted transposase YbfD/YdcC
MARKPSFLVEALQSIPDPRRAGGNLRHPLVNILVLAFCGVLVGCQDFTEIVEFAEAKRDLFDEFLDLRAGIPSVDTFERVFARLCPAALQAALIDWLKEVRRHVLATTTDGPRVVPIDGKTLRRTFNTGAGLAALHLVSAWLSAEGLTLGQVAVDKKSNEITAIPKLLELLELRGAVVTIDAAGCQKEIAAAIRARGGDYLLALKGNQPTLHEQVSDFFLRQCEQPRPDRNVKRIVTTETGHGRTERREVLVAPVPPTLTGREDWAGLTSIVMVCREATEQSSGHTTGDVRYYVSSLPPKARLLARVARAHWGIENGLHWTLDVVFAEDRSRLRTQHGPENWAMLNRVALSLVKSERATKGSLKCKRKRAGWQDDYFLQLLSSGT